MVTERAEMRVMRWRVWSRADVAAARKGTCGDGLGDSLWLGHIGADAFVCMDDVSKIRWNQREWLVVRKSC